MWRWFTCVVTPLALVALLIACTSPTPTPVPAAPAPAKDGAPAGAKPAAAGQPKQGGKLTIGLIAAWRQLDPHKTNAGEDYPPTFWMYNGLTRILHDGNVGADLATEWTSSDDLTKWTFKLRKGVLFHDGREMTADDVIASFNRVLDKDTASLGRAMLSMIDKMNAPDPHTVEFMLNTPYFEFPKALGTIQAKVAPKDKLNTLAQTPVGTGPFKFVEFVPGDFMRLTRNDKYFIQGQPHLSEIVYKVFPEALVASTALKRGEIDIFYGVPPDQVKDLKSAGNEVIFEEAATNNWDAIIVHNERKPYSDVKFRQALNYATDKQKLVDVALFGLGTPVDTPIPPNMPVYKQDLPHYKQDINKAKQLLAEAGFPDGVDITVIAPVGRAERERLGLAVQDMWRAAGIRVKVERVPWDKFVADVEMKGDIYASGLRGRATIDQNLYPWLHSKGSYNMFHYSNPKLDQLLDEARKVKTLDEQKRLYGAVQEELIANPPGVIVWVTNHYTAHRSTVKNYSIHPLFGHLYMDSVWIDK